MARKTQFDEVYSLKNGMERFKSLLDKYRNLYKSKKLTDADAWQLSKDLKEIIHMLQERHEYWDHRRELFLQIALGMIAFSIAILGGIAAVFDKLVAHSPTFVIMGIILVVSLTTIVGGAQLVRVWNRQNNPDYPFTKGYKHWRWQYRYAEEIQRPFKYQYETKEEFEADIEAYIKNLASYAEKTLALKPMEILEQDISQLFLLIENEKYKIKFVSELRNTLTRLLSVALWVGLAAIVVFIALVWFGAYEIIVSSFIG
ncbi:hypothetical protein ES705_42532 [subsurface metagenome]